MSFLCARFELMLSSSHVLQREPEREEQTEDNMPPKFKRHLNDDEVTGSIRSERVRPRWHLEGLG